MRRALIDADLLAYSVSYIKAEDGSERPWPHVASTLVQAIENITRDAGCDEYQLYLSADDKTNFRISEASIDEYKGNRAGERPHWWARVREHMSSVLEARVVSFYEADDQIAIDHTLDPENTIICTLDKDLDMIPGKHYNWKHKELYEITELEGLKNFYCQLLTGDSADNIRGLYGVGTKSSYTAAVRAAITEYDMFKIVLDAYKCRFGNHHMPFLEENYVLLWILRKPVEQGQHPRKEAESNLASLIITSFVRD